MTRIFRIARNMLYAVAVIEIVCTIFCLVVDIRPAVVVSGSMEPAIGTGSLIFINENDREIKCGDIIAFRAGDTEVAHRVIEIKGNEVITKGDSNDSADISPVSREMINGTVSFQIPKAGYFVKWAAGMPGILIITGMAVVTLLGSCLTGKETESEEQ